ncbi:MAG: hypothetical protein PHT58_04200 [Eubacteriales bacterium]|nr:hypothetical protein [Eubacteriales bacterium]
MRETVPCTLQGTRTCAVMNMHSCDRCPCSKGEGKNDELIEDVKLYCDLLPEEGLYSLFDTDQCQLCKGENKGKRSSYALLDMAHAGNARLSKKRSIFQKRPIGLLAPVQFALCSKCRLKLLFLEYIPILTTVLFTALSLFFVSNEDQRRAMSSTSIGFALPLLIVLGCIVVGYVAGRIVKWLFTRKWNNDMYINALEHPFVVKMMEKGWFPLFDSKKSKVVFTKKRIDVGLGTATEDAYQVLDNTEQI